jgi:cytochrome c'
MKTIVFGFVLVSVLALAGCTNRPAPVPAADPVARLDTRTPVPLPAMMAVHQKEQMRAHLETVQAIVAGLAADDLDAVANAAQAIAPSAGTAMQCRHMGAEAPGFTEAALHFHETAGTILEAAKRRDRAAVATALEATLRECTGCHATYRQVVIGS